MSFRTTRSVLALLSLIMLACLIALPVQADEDRQLPAWAQTLTQSQRDQIEHMHHELDDDQAPYKRKEAQALEELNTMTIREDVKISDVNAKIDELMAAKTQIMRLRYDHLIAMRRVLSDEQRIGYDEGVLKRSAVR
jgi:Spy/CpxP family protein refolding chaperone